MDTIRARVEIELQRITEDLGAVIREIEIKDVIILAREDLIRRIAQRENLGLFPGKSRKVL